MKQLFVKITYTNETENYIQHISDIEAVDTQNLTELFWHVRKAERGSIRKMFIDGTNGSTLHVGYVVSRKAKYEDTGEIYVEALWIELLEPVKVMREATEFKPFGKAA